MAPSSQGESHICQAHSSLVINQFSIFKFGGTGGNPGLRRGHILEQNPEGWQEHVAESRQFIHAFSAVGAVHQFFLRQNFESAVVFAANNVEYAAVEVEM